MLIADWNTRPGLLGVAGSAPSRTGTISVLLGSAQIYHILQFHGLEVPLFNDFRRRRDPEGVRPRSGPIRNRYTSRYTHPQTLIPSKLKTGDSQLSNLVFFVKFRPREGVSTAISNRYL